MKEDLSKLSGEDTIKQIPKYILPIVRLNGKKGEFYKYVRGEESGKSEEIRLGDKIQGTILKVRRMFVGFGKEYSIFTNEHNTWKDRITLFERKEGNVAMIDAGTRQELKDKYPELKMTQVIYFLLEPQKEIVKLLIKGKGLANLFEFWRGFKKEEHIYDYVIEIGVKEESSPLGEYFATTFYRVEGVEDEKFIAEKIKEVAGKIAEIAGYYEEKPFVPPEVKTEEIPVIQVGQKKLPKKGEEEEIDVKDIPF